MALRPEDVGRRYAPLALLVAIQVALVYIAPSTPPKQAALGVSQGVGGGSAGQTYDTSGGAQSGTVGTAGQTSGASGGQATTAGGGSAGQAGTSRQADSAPAPGGTSGTGGGNLNKWGYASNDMSHCDKNGLQAGPTSYRPQCRPVWKGGDNGGATMTGVTAKEVRFVWYNGQANAQVNAVLAQKNLATTNEQLCESLQAFVKEVNKRWEFYGRKLVSMDGPGNHAGSKQQSNCSYPYYQSSCSLTPPDPPCYQAEADVIAGMKPAFVLAPVATQTALMQRLAQDHVIVIGGSAGGESIPESYLDQLAPYWWGVLPNGTQTMKSLGEYYCKKLANKHVQYAGTDVMTWDGVTAPPPVRKVAITFPENKGDPVFRRSAELLKQIIDGCTSGSKAMLISYASDINTAQQQSNTTVAQMKQNHITTVVPFDDPIAPVFFSNTCDQQNYHPEILLTGTGYLDYDVVAQLYNPNVWKHAFGQSELGDAQAFSNSDAVKAWHDVGNSGEPGGATNIGWGWVNTMANMIQNAGPRLNLQTIRAGMTNAPAMGGDHINPTVFYRDPFPWSGYKDFRQVWFCPTATSPINNQPGAYFSLSHGARHQLGTWSSSTSGLFSEGGSCAGTT